MNTWREDDYLPGATIPQGGTAKSNETGNWRATNVPRFSKAACQACPPNCLECPTRADDCSLICQRDCLLCWISCPDACIVLENGEIQGINFDYCKGCGICATVCSRGGIVMVQKSESW